MCWLQTWIPALLVVAFVTWMILHSRLEAGPGEALRRWWRRAWPPRFLVLIALLFGSALAFALYDAPAQAKILPVGLDALAASVLFFGPWWWRTLVALPRWLGGDGPSPLRVRTSRAIGLDAVPTTGERP